MGTLKKIFSIFLRVGISIALLAYLFKQVDKKALLDIIGQANKPLLLLAFFVFFLTYAALFFRWAMLLKALKFHIPLKRIFITFAGSHFFSLFLPSTIGGDLVRSIDLATHTRRPHEVIATVVLDRLSGYIGLVLLALFSFMLGGGLIQDKAVFISLSIITGVLVGILLVLFNRFCYSRVNSLLHSPQAGKIRQLIKDLHDELHYFKQHKKVIFLNILLSLLIQSIVPVSFYFLALALGLKIHPVYFFIFLPISERLPSCRFPSGA
jgi:uncharacterized protein (TIRG00374 family)